MTIGELAGAGGGATGSYSRTTVGEISSGCWRSGSCTAITKRRCKAPVRLGARVYLKLRLENPSRRLGEQVLPNEVVERAVENSLRVAGFVVGSVILEVSSPWPPKGGDWRPAPSPGFGSRRSVRNPRLCAQRRYMRRSISAQS